MGMKTKENISIDILYRSDGKKEILTTIGKEAEILPGGISEFYHNVGEGTAAIGLRIPIYEVKDIDSAKAKAKKEGLNAEVIETKDGHKYLEISYNGYREALDELVVKKLKEVAIAVSTEDYSNHIKSLEFSITKVEEVE